jgi:hypothetical protein
VGSAREAFDARLRLRSALEDEVPRALERAFERAAPGDAPVHIPRLELRLRVPDLEALAERLAEALDEALERELRFQVPTAAPAAALDSLEVLLGYLDTGALAWHAAQSDPPVAASALRATLLENVAAVAQRGPPEKASRPEAVQFYFRLLALLPLEQWPALAASTSPSSEGQADPAAIASVVAALLARDTDPSASAPEALALACRSPRAAIAALIALRPPVRDRAQRIAAAILAAAPSAQSAQRFDTTSVDAPPSAAHPVPNREQRAGEAHQKTQQAPRESPARAVPVTRNDESAIAQPFALMVGNAGLVLLHPFFPRLLETCNLQRDGRLTEIEKAAALLHWLATGREEVHEFELGFVKLLLGLRPEAPLAVGEGLVGERSRAEGEALLASVIGHWKALGKTSAEALRVAFLQRRGALREDESGWRLQPEPESYDVLLGRLPWGLATVKLPWMTRPLYTDWPTP